MVLPREITGIDLAAVLGIDERSVRKLTTKNVLKRTALGYDLADAVQSYVAFRESSVAAAHGVGDFGRARSALYTEPRA